MHGLSFPLASARANRLTGHHPTCARSQDALVPRSEQNDATADLLTPPGRKPIRTTPLCLGPGGFRLVLGLAIHGKNPELLRGFPTAVFWPLRFVSGLCRNMKLLTRSSVRVVQSAPPLNRSTNLLSSAASRPKTLARIPEDRRKTSISSSRCSRRGIQGNNLRNGPPASSAELRTCREPPRYLKV